MMYGKINLADGSLISTGDLPFWTLGLGLTDDQLADLGAFGLIGIGYWPVKPVVPAYDPTTQMLGAMLPGAPDPATRTVPATYAVETLPPPLVPDRIARWQFAQILALPPFSLITQDEAESWGARGDLPDKMEQAVGQLPAEQRFGARMLLTSAASFLRSHPMVPVFGEILLASLAPPARSGALDMIWREGAKLL